MLIQPLIVGTVKEINYNGEYVYCTYNNENVIEIYNDNLITGITRTCSNIIASTTLEALNAEIILKGLIMPE